MNRIPLSPFFAALCTLSLYSMQPSSLFQAPTQQKREIINQEIIRLIEQGNVEVFQSYIEREGIGFDRRVTQQGFTLLMAAVDLNNNDIARWLLERTEGHSNLASHVDYVNNTALEIAISRGNLEAVHLLLPYTREEDLLRRHGPEGTILCQAAAAFFPSGNEDKKSRLRKIIRLLLHHPCVCMGINNHPVAHSAYWYVRHDPELRELFLQHGAIPE